jgi:hypothetical protein
MFFFGVFFWVLLQSPAPRPIESRLPHPAFRVICGRLDAIVVRLRVDTWWQTWLQTSLYIFDDDDDADIKADDEEDKS